jgi:hypothetical protein
MSHSQSPELNTSDGLIITNDDQAENSPAADFDMLISIDFTKPQDSQDRYTATIVPPYPESEIDKKDSQKHLFVSTSAGRLVSGWLSSDEFLPIEQEVGGINGNGSDMNQAIGRAVTRWMISLQSSVHGKNMRPQ